jgi:hypothetical protein
MPDRDELMAEAEKCRSLAGDVDALTGRILNELADQYEAEANLLSAEPGAIRKVALTGFQLKPSASSRRTWICWGIAIPGSSHRRQALILLGRDVLGDTSYSFGCAHVHLNLVDMTAPCAAKRPVLEAHARRRSAQDSRARSAHRAADRRDGGR